MFKDKIKFINGLLVHIKLYCSVNIYYSFWLESPSPHENIIWDLIWECRTSDLIGDHIWDPLIYKIADDMTYMRSPIRSHVPKTYMRSHMIWEKSKALLIISLYVFFISFPL